MSVRLVFLLLCALPGFALVSIEGRVVNSETNEPVPQANLTLKLLVGPQRPGRGPQAIEGETLPDGSFRFNSLYPMQYRLTVTGAPGMVPTKSSTVEVDFARSYSSLSGVVLKLAPESTIAGKVLDETGQPKAGVAVDALRQSFAGAARQITLVSKAVTDEKGVYVLHNIAAGNYYVATPLPHEDKNDLVDPYFFYAPDALSLEQAVLTHINTGQRYSDIDVHLRPVAFYHLQGRAQTDTINSVASDKPQLHLDARDSSGVLMPAREILLNPDGTFQTEVLPGSYTLRLSNAFHLLARQDIEVSGKDLMGLIVLIPPPITVTGRAHLEGASETRIGSGKVMLRPVEAVAIGGNQIADLQTDGAFVLPNCEPANYAVRFSPPDGTFIKSLVFNQQDVMTHPLDLSRGSGGELTITVGQGTASISGTISNVGEPPPSFELTLIPDTWVETGLVPLRRITAKEGHFSLHGIPPGRYSAIATSSIASILWENAIFIHEMQSRGVSLELAENDQKQLTVPYLTFAETEQIQTRLAIN